VSACFCAALAELSVLSDDPREETRLRRTIFGIEIQRWRLASTILVPEGGAGSAPAFDARGLAGAIPRAVQIDESTLENVADDSSPARRLAHEHA
jgi:hypothetical protein